MARHVYTPPKGKFTSIFAVIGGLIASIAVFVAIPLSQKLSEMLDKASPPTPEISVDPPDDLDIAIDEPPPTVEPEAEPEQLVEGDSDVDIGMDIGDLTTGTGGGFVMEIPKFAMKGGDDVIGGDIDSPPQPTSKPQPTYPSSMLKKGIGGKVMVSCTVDITGLVVGTTIKESSGYPELDKAALTAVNKWKFKPGTRGGKKAKCVAIVPCVFEVKK